ncbi:MAG: hypothetical protein JST06_10035 [Bacteroidetes bacterium]|nr:hypothetical protein [Bacteroidota bacterium]
MARLIIHRSEPFRRGDFIIQIYVDGQRAAKLFSENELELNLRQAEHRIQARSLGVRGKVTTLILHDDDCTRLYVSPIRIEENKWPLVSFVFLLTIFPTTLFKDKPYLFYFQMVLLLLFGAWSFYSLRKKQKKWLVLEDKPGSLLEQEAPSGVGAVGQSV